MTLEEKLDDLVGAIEETGSGEDLREAIAEGFESIAAAVREGLESVAEALKAESGREEFALALAPAPPEEN